MGAVRFRAANVREARECHAKPECRARPRGPVRCASRCSSPRCWPASSGLRRAAAARRNEGQHPHLWDGHIDLRRSVGHESPDDRLWPRPGHRHPGGHGRARSGKTLTRSGPGRHHGAARRRWQRPTSATRRSWRQVRRWRTSEVPCASGSSSTTTSEGDDCAVEAGYPAFIETRFNFVREGLCGNDPSRRLHRGAGTELREVAGRRLRHPHRDRC